MSVPVLIVGAGPTGLMLANQLLRRGIRPMIIDRHTGPSIQTKAIGVQARTLEIYARMGIVREALDRGALATGAEVWVAGRKRARVPLGAMGRGLSPYPFLLLLGQDENERILGDAMRGHGMDVAWESELIGLEPGRDGVTARVKAADGAERTIEAKWVAGCDGAHSTVRELAGIDFPGAPYEHVFYVADTTATGAMVAGELNICLWRKGFHLFFPMPGTDHWRVIGILPPHLRDRDDLTFEMLVPEIRGEIGFPVTFSACRWLSSYRIHHRRAARFQAGRIFVLGDAAHVHSPVGAQGMNTGLQDAYNLAWKLALVASGRADLRLLETFRAEREPVANWLLNRTDRAFTFLVSDGRVSGWLRTHLLPRAMAFAMRRAPVQRFAFRTISQIGIRYPDSPLSQALSASPNGAPEAGDRFPWVQLPFEPDLAPGDLFDRLDDTRFNLILFGQPLPEGALGRFAGLVLTHGVEASWRSLGQSVGPSRAASIPSPSFYLLRPDGHVGLSGGLLDGDAIPRYFKERIGMR